MGDGKLTAQGGAELVWTSPSPLQLKSGVSQQDVMKVPETSAGAESPITEGTKASDPETWAPHWYVKLGVLRGWGPRLFSLCSVNA